MSRKSWFTLFTTVALILCSTIPALAQEGGEADYMKLIQPGEHHKHLDAYAGTWNVELKMYQAPGAEPMVSNATSTFEWILQGHYMTEKLEGDMMGMPFQGMSLFGYDNFRKEHVSLWVDNFSTALITAKGSCNAEDMQTVMEGTMDDVMSGTKDKWYKTVTTMPKDGKFTMQMWMKGPDGKEFMNMVATYTKKS